MQDDLHNGRIRIMEKTLEFSSTVLSTLHPCMYLIMHEVHYCIIAISQWMSASRLKPNAEKTELMWAGTRYSIAYLLLCNHNLRLTLGVDIVKAMDVIWVLCMLFTSDLALEKQVASVGAKCFFQLHQLRREAFTRPL